MSSSSEPLPVAELTHPGFFTEAVIPILLLVICFVAGPIVLCCKRRWKLRQIRLRQSVLIRAKKLVTHIGITQRLSAHATRDNNLILNVLQLNKKERRKSYYIPKINSTNPETDVKNNDVELGDKANSDKDEIKESCNMQATETLGKLEETGNDGLPGGGFITHQESKNLLGADWVSISNVPECARYDPLYRLISSAGKDTKQQISHFLTTHDHAILHSLCHSVYSPRELFRISFPCLLSLALCPFTLYLYQPLVDAFWFSTDPNMVVLPNVNEAILCFLMPAGVVYATSFGFAIQTAVEKQVAISKSLTKEIGMLDQITTLTAKLVSATREQKCLLYTVVKNEAINLIQDIGNKKTKYDYKESCWYVANMLRNLKLPRNEFQLDTITADKIVQLLLKIKDNIGRKVFLHGRIHLMQWLFLELLGFITFFGILLTQTQSYRSDLAICMLTVFSISLLCYVVADLDSPFSGFFHIDISTILSLIERTENMYKMFSTPTDTTTVCGYPSARRLAAA